MNGMERTTTRMESSIQAGQNQVNQYHTEGMMNTVRCSPLLASSRHTHIHNHKPEGSNDIATPMAFSELHQ